MVSVFLFLGTFLHLWGPLRLPSRATDTERSENLVHPFSSLRSPFGQNGASERDH